MQKTAKKTAPLTALTPLQQTIQATGISPYVGGNQFSYVGATYQPTITWQDTTSNATYSSAANVLNIT